MNETSETMDVLDNDDLEVTAKIELAKKKEFYLGGGKRKHFIDALVGKDGEMKMKLVEKETLSGFNSDHVLKIWKRCKENNVNTIDFMAKTSRDTIIMSNLTHDGSEIYGRSLLFTISSYEHGEKKEELNEIDKKFIKLMQEEGEKVNEAAFEVAKNAAEAGINIASEDPLDLIFHPDGLWEVIALDLENAVLDSSLPNEERRVRLEKSNLEAAQVFLKNLEKIIKTPLFQTAIS